MGKSVISLKPNERERIKQIVIEKTSQETYIEGAKMNNE
jgi:hypothetical protein